mgnify:CR=1 FL=1
MARAKKEAALTPEERLQAALVPDWEWPYKLPENWCWVYAPHIFDIEYGKGLPTKQLSDTGYPVFGANGQIGFYSEYMYKEPQALMSCRGAYSGTMNKSLPYSYVTSNSLIISSPRGLMGADCIYYLFSALNVSELISGTAQPQVTVQAFDGFPIPLSPLAEQQRIVDRIESLFAKLDEAKEKAQAVVDSFETRKAAILHKAFTGELTAKWRRTHGVSLDTWKEVAADSLFEYVTSGSRGWAKYYDESGAVFIRMGNLDHGTIELDFSDIQHVKLPNKAEGQRSRIRKNDILISITADVGMVGLVRNDDFEGYINQHIALARPVMSESAEFIAWYLVSDIGLKQMQEKQRGATKVGLSLNDIRALQLKIPLIEEQNEILKVIKMWIGKEQQSQEAAEAVLDQIDLMKKSILARAFRGELGTNDPSEESAVELLKQLI